MIVIMQPFANIPVIYATMTRRQGLQKDK